MLLRWLFGVAGVSLVVTSSFAATFQGLGDLPGGSVQSYAYGVSADGSTIVGSSSSSNGTPEAFRWTSASGMQPMGDLTGGAFASSALAVSASGSSIVGNGNSNSPSSSTTEAFRWTSATGMQGIGELSDGMFFSEAFGVSGDGSAIVGRSADADGFKAFRWTSGGGMQNLGDLPGGDVNTLAIAASFDGSIVVGFGSATGVLNQAFIWDPSNGTRNLQTVLVNDYGLDLSGWTLREAYGVSADGKTLVGWGNHGGNDEAFIASIPEPSTAALAACGACAMLRRAGRPARRIAITSAIVY